MSDVDDPWYIPGTTDDLAGWIAAGVVPAPREAAYRAWWGTQSDQLVDQITIMARLAAVP
jgi:hypothetical protein